MLALHSVPRSITYPRQQLLYPELGGVAIIRPNSGSERPLIDSQIDLTI